MPDLTESIALVTGAGRGIGRGIALGLARAGAHVILSARSGDQIDAAAAEIEESGGKALAVPADVASESDVDALFETIETSFGRLDVLVNNAGIGLYGPVVDFPVEDFDKVMAVNLRGAYLCCHYAMQMMVPRRSGYIINISSVVGFKGYANQAAYAASKHGVMGLTKSLAVEAQQHGIRVSAILPGAVDTKIAHEARPDLDPAILMQPDDVAGAVMYLLSLSPRAAVDEIYIRRIGAAPF
jgi:3-oxoacyl-[acyl-carrier protein] reductase